MINRPGLIKYFGLGLVIAFMLIGCSSGGGDSAGGGGGGGGTTANTANITQGTVATPGTLGPLVDIADLVGAGDNWYETRIMALGDNDSVAGQTTRSGGPVKAAFLWDDITGMQYLGIHGEAGPLAAFPVYDDTVPIPHAFIYSEAVGIGPTGDVICNSTTGYGWPEDTEKRAFYWAAGTQTDLAPSFDPNPATMGHYSEAFDVNATYVVLNRELTKNQPITAWSWDKAGTFGGLGQIVGAGVVEPIDINNNNQVVTNSLGTTAVFHDLDLVVDAVQTLNGLPGSSESTAAAISETLPTGHIVGKSGDMAFFWDGGSMYPCGTLGGSTSEATDLNDFDQVVGHSTTASGATHAFVWQLDASGQGVMTDLGTLGGENSYATAINNNGLIVGYAETGAIYSQGGVTQPIVHACAWYGNVIYDLGIHNDFYTFPFVEPYPFSEAIDVNDNNRIAGNSYTINQHYRGFVLDPDPSIVP